MKTFKYESYSDYIKKQRLANREKYDMTWASEENIKAISKYLKPRHPLLGLCHGARNGSEVKFFNKHLPKCQTWGTDLGQSSAPGMVVWDFNHPREEWLGKFDFIYSNSFDHAFDPEITFKVWRDQVRDGGLIILEWSKKHEHAGEEGNTETAMDPLAITIDELVAEIPAWAANAKVIEIINLPQVYMDWQQAIIIEVVK